MATNKLYRDCGCNRRDFMRQGLYGIGVTAALPWVFRDSSTALAMQALAGGQETHPDRIMVVLELSGGNDGLNTVVPYGNDEYYQLRPSLAVPARAVLPIDDDLGFNPQLRGLRQLYDEGQVAIINGCGYPNPSMSHFTAMDWWHSAVPHQSEQLGWVGRLADAVRPTPQENFIVNITTKMANAVQAGVHAPVVFNDPDRFQRQGSDTALMAAKELDAKMPDAAAGGALGFVESISRNAATGSVLVREAIGSYSTPVDYGDGGDSTSLPKVAALIDGGLPTRFYYINYGGFDHHSNQDASHARLLLGLGDALKGFFEDMERIGRADDVAMMIFSEFGRRPGQNASDGTDHGTAGPMFILGKHVTGGLYGAYPSLTDLDVIFGYEDGNLKFTTDFRRVYATMIKEWMGYDDTDTLLRGDFAPLGVFA
ncbi:MAG: DUF1501 domain-containing protein [Vicinamibacterales bacterium]|nr:DUF1501 domain-containing protein [Vicinamibacterales bacterium]HJN43347.1 DUF1501 domain-containing protein [Vicinamibacterales bacterium]